MTAVSDADRDKAISNLVDARLAWNGFTIIDPEDGEMHHGTAVRTNEEAATVALDILIALDWAPRPVPSGDNAGLVKRLRESGTEDREEISRLFDEAADALEAVPSDADLIERRIAISAAAKFWPDTDINDDSFDRFANALEGLDR